MQNSIWFQLIPWNLVATIVGGLILTYVLTPVYNLLHISAQSKVRGDMQTAIQNALQYAIANAQGKPEDIVKDDELWNSVISVGKDYLSENATGLMKHLGVNTDSSVTKALEAQMLTAVNSFVFQNGQILAVASDPTNAVQGTTVNVTTPAAA